MVRYIDAIKLLDVIDCLDTVQGTDNTVFTYDVIQAIQNMPTANANDAKRGRWNLKEKDIFCYCSCCGCKSGALFNYCPHCGARMNGWSNRK